MSRRKRQDFKYHGVILKKKNFLEHLMVWNSIWYTRSESVLFKDKRCSKGDAVTTYPSAALISFESSLLI